MKHRTLVLLVISILSLQITFAQSLRQQGQEPRKGLGMLYYFRPEGCHPVEIIGITNGSNRPEVWTSRVTIKSLSQKPVKALKLRWDIYQWDIGQKKHRDSCGEVADSAEIILSGNTPLIDVGRLLNGELYSISSHPQEIFSAQRVSKTLLVDYPLIGWDQLKPLTTDGTFRGLKDAYAGIVYVGEIHFEDGTRWEAGKKL